MITSILLLIVSTIAASVSTYVAYNLYLHPLSKYPGPWTWRAFRFSMLRTMLGGRLPHRLRELHREYGPIVRVAPDELSFCLPQAWPEIYQRRDFHRPPQWRGKPPGLDADSLIQADAPTHARFRKAFGPAFSEKAVRGYESSITSHLDLLVQKLRTKSSSNTPIDLSKWMNFCLFDITMSIGWGASFSLLEQETYHPWVIATQGLKELLIGTFLAYYQPLGSLAARNMPKEAKDSIAMVLRTTRHNVHQRLLAATDPSRRDIFANTLGAKPDLSSAGLTEEEMVANSMNYVIAGSESVTTVLVAAFHHLLLKNPSALRLLSSEIRSAFPSPQSITGVVCGSLPYLNAVLKEALRLVPTTPDGLRREIHVEGVTVCGEPIPKNTVVSVPTWAVFTSPDYWREPERFVPERWLAEPAEEGGECARNFGEDVKEAWQPFGYGPRNCIGLNLGWEEMRMMLARLVWEFEIGLPEGEGGRLEEWATQEVYWFWIKRPLNVRIGEAAK